MAKQRLIEGALFTAQHYQKVDTPLKEAVVDGKTYPALGVYTFPFTRPGQKNLNGRIYGYPLWDRIFTLFQNKSTVGLMNHPEDDGNPKDIWCVWKNLRYNHDKTLGLADCYIIDNEWGRTAIGVLENGGDVGLSTSGFGDFEADGITIDPDTYELERVADWVLNPSYSVFGTANDKKEKTNYEKKTYPVVKEGYPMKKALTLREKREVEASLKKIYESVKDIPDLKERLSRAKEALSFYEEENSDVDFYKKEFEQLVKEIEKEFEDRLKAAEDAVESKKEAQQAARTVKEKDQEIAALKTENDDLKKKVETLEAEIKEAQSLNKASTDLLASMTENAKQHVSWEKYTELREYAVNATRQYSELKTERNVFQIKVQELTQQIKDMKQSQMEEYQKAMAERARIEKSRQRTVEANTLRKKQLEEAQEKALVESANPDVLLYWHDLLKVDEAFASKYRKEILSKKTETEAQLFVLKVKNEAALQNRKKYLPEGFTDRDLKTPLPMKNFKDTMPYVPISLPKGFI